MSEQLPARKTQGKHIALVPDLDNLRSRAAQPSVCQNMPRLDIGSRGATTAKCDSILLGLASRLGRPSKP